MYKNNSPHQNRRTNIHIWILCLAGFVLLLLLLSHCSSPRSGCRSTRGLSGYHYKK